jgi:excisionase family DNA binding protein
MSADPGQGLAGRSAALSTKEAAALLGVSSDCLWRAAAKGTAPVPHFRVGRRVCWPAAPIAALLHSDEPPTDEAGVAESGPRSTAAAPDVDRNGHG